MIKRLIGLLFFAYTLMLLARILGSWFPQWQGHPIMRLVAQYTDPYLDLFKRVIPPLGPLDLSPVAALFGLQILEWLLFTIF